MASEVPGAGRPMIEAEPSDPRFPGFDDGVLAELSEFGEERAVETGTVLFRAGESSGTFYVLLGGGVDVRRDDGAGSRPGPVP